MTAFVCALTDKHAYKFSKSCDKKVALYSNLNIMNYVRVIQI
ncbi:hypothetical protein PBN151_5205 [Paenibacillus sp. NAIST15-1]|nr:hypothetical protein PBN151_5205 [Paenibacillus sp. NAIST15-1]